MRITFLNDSIDFDGGTLATRPLGGAETALIGIARALAREASCTVDVFTGTSRPGRYDGVDYHPLRSLGEWADSHDTDVLVSLRQWLPFILPVRSRLRIYWSPDPVTEPFLHRAIGARAERGGKSYDVPLLPPREFMPAVDAIYCVGRWQAATFASELRFPPEKLVVSGNGHFPQNFEPLPLAARRLRVFHSAVPWRGLAHLLRYFPQLRQRHPQLELEVCSGLGVYGFDRETDHARYGALYESLRQQGAISHGAIVQAELHRLMCAARVYAYPNTTPETFCISVLEAQAAGLPVVTSRLGAMEERMVHGEDGFLIEGRPGEPAYDAAFIDAVSRLVTDDGLWTAMSHAARERAAPQTYERLAAQWLGDFTARLQRRSATPGIPQAWLPSMAGFDFPVADGPPLRIDAAMVRALVKTQAAAYGFAVNP